MKYLKFLLWCFALLCTSFLYAQDIRQNIKLTDSCRACSKQLAKETEVYVEAWKVLNKSIIELNDSLKKYEDSLSYSYGWDYVAPANIPELRAEWNQKLDDFKKNVADLELREDRVKMTIDSFERLQRPNYKQLEVRYKENPRDTLAVLEYCRQNNGLDIGFNHPRLKDSKIANLPIGDSMNFYFFTWYTIKGNWKDIEGSKNRFTYNRSREQDNVLNGDLAHGVYSCYDSLGYTRVWFLRKLTLTRQRCFWLITAYEDIYFNRENLEQAQIRYDSMMNDGKERFSFQYEATFANCLTEDRLWEFTYPVNFLEGERHTNDYLRLNDLVWRFAEYELMEPKAKAFRSEATIQLRGANKNYTMNYMTNNFLVTFSNGTCISRHIPYWLYLKKHYDRYWTPPAGFWQADEGK